MIEKGCSVIGCKTQGRIIKTMCEKHYKRMRMHGTTEIIMKQGRPQRTKEELKKYLLTNRRITENGCWEFTGKIWENGYGIVGYQGKYYGVHRLSAHLDFDFDLSSRLLICHKCDNPPCFNPHHLFIGNDKDNTQDSIKKNRWMTEKRLRAFKRKLTETQVMEIRQRGRNGEKHQRIANDFPVTRRTIGKIIQGTRWAQLPLQATPAS